MAATMEETLPIDALAAAAGCDEKEGGGHDASPLMEGQASKGTGDDSEVAEAALAQLYELLDLKDNIKLCLQEGGELSNVVMSSGNDSVEEGVGVSNDEQESTANPLTAENHPGGVPLLETATSAESVLSAKVAKQRFEEMEIRQKEKAEMDALGVLQKQKTLGIDRPCSLQKQKTLGIDRPCSFQKRKMLPDGTADKPDVSYNALQISAEQEIAMLIAAGVKQPVKENPFQGTWKVDKKISVLGLLDHVSEWPPATTGAEANKEGEEAKQEEQDKETEQEARVEECELEEEPKQEDLTDATDLERSIVVEKAGGEGEAVVNFAHVEEPFVWKGYGDINCAEAKHDIRKASVVDQTCCLRGPRLWGKKKGK